MGIKKRQQYFYANGDGCNFRDMILKTPAYKGGNFGNKPLDEEAYASICGSL